jgi:hypothetical protein
LGTSISAWFESVRKAIPDHTPYKYEYVPEYLIDGYIAICYIGGSRIPLPLLYFFDSGSLNIDPNSLLYQRSWQGTTSMVLRMRHGYRFFVCGPKSGTHVLKLGYINDSQDANSVLTEQIPPVPPHIQSRVFILFVQWGRNSIDDVEVWQSLYSHIVSGTSVTLNSQFFKNNGGLEDEKDCYAVIYYIYNDHLDGKPLQYWPERNVEAFVGRNGAIITLPNSK